VESSLSVTVHRFNVWRSQLSFKLFERLDDGRKCGGLPYFYNTRTKQGICGASTAGNFKLWASDKPCSFYFYDPGAADRALGDKAPAKRNVGFLGRVASRMERVKKETKSAMTDKLEEATGGGGGREEPVAAGN
jgi:hypothetical protein